MPVVRLFGLYEDGAPPAPDVPTNPRYPLQITQDATYTVELAVLNPAGDLVDLAAFLGLTGSIILTVKRTYYGVFGVPADLQVTAALVPTAGVNRANFTITPTLTRLLEPGVFAYDIWMQDSSSPTAVREPLIPTSPFHLEPSVRVV